MASTFVAFMTFAVGLAVLGYGVLFFAKSFPVSLLAMVGGCAITLLGALSLAMVEPAYSVKYMAWPAAAFLGVLLFQYGPGSRAWSWRRIVLSCLAILFAGSLVLGAYNPGEAMVEAFPAVLFCFALARYRPSSRWLIWLRRGAYSAMGAYAALVYVSVRTALAMTRQGCFWIAGLPFGYSLRLPHPYDYYLTYQVEKYLILSSLFLTLVCSLVCLCMWPLEKRRPQALRAAKLLH